MLLKQTKNKICDTDLLYIIMLYNVYVGTDIQYVMLIYTIGVTDF